MADRGPGAGFLLHKTRALLRPSRPRGQEQGTVAQEGLRVGDTDVAGDETPRRRYRGTGRRFPTIVRPRVEHDTLLHGQQQEIVPHVQELRHREHLGTRVDPGIRDPRNQHTVRGDGRMNGSTLGENKTTYLRRRLVYYVTREGSA